jgi:hypothetical protein
MEISQDRTDIIGRSAHGGEITFPVDPWPRHFQVKSSCVPGLEEPPDQTLHRDRPVTWNSPRCLGKLMRDRGRGGIILVGSGACYGGATVW